MKNQKIKILHVLRVAGGVGISLKMILANINKDKFDNLVVLEDEDYTQSYIDPKSKTQIYRLSIPREISIFKDIRAAWKVRKIINKEKINLIHAHSSKGGLIARLAVIGKKTKVLYTPQAFSYLSTDNKVKRYIFLSAEKILKYFNSILLASSHSEQIRAIKEVGYKEKQTILFNNAIEPIKITELEIEQTWPDNYLCTVGRPSYQKRLDMMIKVIAELKKEIPDIHLVIMGVGFYSPELNKIKTLIQKLDIEKNISLLEWTDQQNVYYIIKHSQLYISTARYEGLPYSIIEALALGKPVVATDVDGNRDLIIDNYNGFLVPGDDVLDMKNKILKIINKPEKLKEFGENSKKLFEEKFNIKKQISQLEKIYEIML